MAVNLPFLRGRGLPLPRRVLLVLGVSTAVFLVLSLVAPRTLPPVLTPHITHHEPDSSLWSASKWLPPIFQDVPDRPSAFDENGQCRFLSPFAALSAREREAVEELVLEEESAGIVRGPAQEANSSRINPILGLLYQGERKWTTLVESQSKTLEQAVHKYEAKWGRPPPKGFDDWWLFAQDHDALLIDEFDAIMESLLPYYGMSLPLLKTRREEAEGIAETFTLIVHDGKVELQWNDNYSRDRWWASRPRADAQINLMEPFIGLLPSFRATFSIHDQPSILLDYKRQDALVNAALAHKVVTGPEEVDRFEQNWQAACSPTSPLNRGMEEPPAADTFISRHLDTMNPCDHPSLMENHGMLLEKHTKDTQPKPHTKLYPILVPSKTILNGDIPITPVGRDGRRDDVGLDPAWKDKSGKVYWRGRATGLQHNKGNGAKWRQSHRERLHWLANDKTGKVQEVLSPLDASGHAAMTRYSLRDLGQYYMDAKLIPGPWQCDQGDGTCDEMAAEIDFAGEAPMEEANQFKYILDVDGNAWSSRFPRLMASLNVIIKATLFPEWNSHHLPEWFAYVPTKVDYSDLYSILAFFRGTPSGKGSHDEVARRIALNGQCWVERTWRREDLQIYMFRLYLEYARLMSPDRDTGKMDFVLQDYHRDPKVELPKLELGNDADDADGVKKMEAFPGIES